MVGKLNGKSYTIEFVQILCPQLLLGIIGVALCFYLDALESIKSSINNPLIYGEYSVSCVLHYITEGYSFGGVFCTYLMPILTALPYAASYSVEESNYFVPYKIARSGKRHYSLAKILTAAVSGGLTALIGTLLFTLILSTYLPLVTPQDILETQVLPFGTLLFQGGGIPFLMVVMYLITLSGALWAESGLWISAFFPNQYVALCFPMLFKFLMTQTGRLLRLPDGLRLDKILCVRGTFLSDKITLVVASLTVLILITIMGRSFRKRIERRMEDAS